MEHKYGSVVYYNTIYNQEVMGLDWDKYNDEELGEILDSVEFMIDDD